MDIINIIHEEKNAFEYVYISLFFKLFGIQTYNSVNGTAPKKMHKSVPNKKIVNIVILDKAIEKYNENYIYVSSCGVKNISDVVINFPSSLYADNGNECRAFFEQLLHKLMGIYDVEQNKELFGIFNEMIEMYIDCDMINNYYLPFSVLRYSDEIKERLDKLYKKSEKYSYYITVNKKNNLTFAAINLKYLVNRICTSMNFFPLYNWDILIKDIEHLNKITNVSAQQITLLAGLILDESRRNVRMMAKFYESNINEYSYYKMYRLGRVYETRFNDRKKASEWFQLSWFSNSNYYRSIYKLGVYNEERYNYEKAALFYNIVIQLLKPVINGECWQPIEMAYCIKSELRRMTVFSHIAHNNMINNYLLNTEKIIKTILEKKNKHLYKLCMFVGDKEGMLKKMLYDDIEINVKTHLKQYGNRSLLEKIYYKMNLHKKGDAHNGK